MSPNSVSADDASWLDLLRGANALRVLVLAAGVALHAINLYLTTTILPSVVDDIGGVAFYAWNTTLFIVASITGAAVAAQVIQHIGPRGAYLLGAAVFGGGSALCALAPTMPVLLVARVLQGLGGGVLLSAPYVLMRSVLPEPLWPRALALLSGMWGIATLLPNVIAPLVGGWLIGIFHGTRAGYQAVFGLSGFSFALASLAVLRVGRRPISSLWALPLRFVAVLANFTWDHCAYRVRNWGRLPRRRGPTVIVANHQHDLESMSIVTTTAVQSGPWRHPIFTASSRRMYAPGFLATRLPWLRAPLRRVNAGPLFIAFGMLPLENELGAREIGPLAWSVQQRHGPLLLRDVFDERVASEFPDGTKTSDLWRRDCFAKSRAVVKLATLREPYRREILDETRANIESDLALMEGIVRRGATFYLTPEGKYSTDGRIGPMRGVIERLAPLATIYLAGVSYDPFVSRRLSMLYRVVCFGRLREDGMKSLTRTLAAVRPVVTSQLLGAWLATHDEPFTEDEACATIEARLAAVPGALFVDPELRRNPRRMVRSALPLMVGWNILQRDGNRYRLAAIRRHPQFPFVEDIIAYQARFLEETFANVDRTTYEPAH